MRVPLGVDRGASGRFRFLEAVGPKTGFVRHRGRQSSDTLVSGATPRAGRRPNSSWVRGNALRCSRARTLDIDMDFAFILDPLPELKAYKDSSIAMMRALDRRGHRVHALQQGDIFWESGVTRASVRPLTLSADDHDWYREGERETRQLKD